MDRAYEQKLFHCCRILFGAEVDVGWDFLFYLQPAGIKTAFRQRALLTHPDRALLRGDSGGGMTSLFIESKDACENLLDFVRRRHRLRPARTAAAAPGPARKPGSARTNARSGARDGGAARAAGGRRSYFYRGALPRRRLLIGEFLFYSGAVSWESLIRAIVWQRRQRPRLGDIASQRGWISEAQAGRLSRSKGLGVPMGEAMIRAGLLSALQVRTLLYRQRQMQSALGEFFVSERLLTRAALEALIARLAGHNGSYPQSRRG